MRRRSIEEFLKEAKGVHGNKYDYSLVRYKNNETLIKIVCRIHGKFFQTPYHHLHAKFGCNKCRYEAAGKERGISIVELERLYPDLIKGQKQKTGTHPKYKFLCLIHGMYLMSHNSRQNGQGCPKCGRLRIANSHRLDIFKVEKSWPDMISGQKWKGTRAKYLFRCLNGRHENYKQTYNDHKGGSGCPLCRESKGEKIIRQWLKGHMGAGTFEHQKRFITCRRINPLPFDFGSDKFKILIEYNGGHHYHPGIFNGFRITKRGFRIVKENDLIKRRWARHNGYKLIVVPYTIKDIPRFLEKKLGSILS